MNLRLPITMRCGCACQECWTCPQMHATETRDVASLPLAFGGSSSLLVQLGGCTEHDFTATHNSGDHTLVHELSGHRSAHLKAAAQSADQLRGLEGFDVPSWADLAAGVRPNLRNAKEVEPASFRTGWHHEAAARMEWQHRERVVKPVLSDSARALLRAQSGPAAGMSLSAVPSSPQTRIESQLFRVLLLRRLRLPLPPASRLCRCGRLLDSFGHHRASSAQAGFWEDGDSLWRVLRRACVERQEEKSPQTCLCATSTSQFP